MALWKWVRVNSGVESATVGAAAGICMASLGLVAQRLSLSIWQRDRAVGASPARNSQSVACTARMAAYRASVAGIDRRPAKRAS